MKLKNFLIVTRDIDRAVNFYRDIFGLQVVVDLDGNVIMTDGLVLQDAKYWEQFLGREVIPRNNSCELYFEESDIKGFVDRLDKSGYDIEYVNKLMTHSWGQTVVRFYDPDGNLIEVGTPF
ncbi:MAG: VOC family protein [Clostridiales bacterium]|nr:VOC family protein [Candidatus Crickella merdequi]